MKPAMLALADGTVFEGLAYGAEGEAVGEVVFNTSLSGYQEILTDPSYKGQIVTMTYPLMGNYGVNPEDVESRRPFVEGFVVKAEPSLYYIDIGSEKGIRKGSKCVAFRVGEEIKHPITGEVLGNKVTKLGELVVVAVYEKMSAVRVSDMEGDIAVGDKVVVK